MYHSLSREKGFHGNLIKSWPYEINAVLELHVQFIIYGHLDSQLDL